MRGFAISVAEVFEWLEVLELLGFDLKTGVFVQDSESTARAISETIEDITIAQAILHATECFLRQPTLANYLALVNAVDWVPETREEVLAHFERFLMARGACAAEPASTEIGAVPSVTLDRPHYGAALALEGDNAAAG